MVPMRPCLRTYALLGAALLGLGCNDRLIDSDQIPAEPYCMFAAGTMGTRADGTSAHLIDPVRDATPYVCSCVTEEQFWDEVLLAQVKDDLNDDLLVECERVADAEGFVSNECQLHHDIDHWVGGSLFAIGKFALPFSCPGEGWIEIHEPEPPICELGEPGCSCTVEAKCSGGTTCIDGMCQAPP